MAELADVLIRYDQVDSARETARALKREAGEDWALVRTVSDGFLIPGELAARLGIGSDAIEPARGAEPADVEVDGEVDPGADAAETGAEEPGQEPDPEPVHEDLAQWLHENTVPQVVRYLAENPDDVEEVVAAERAGQNRKGITEYVAK